MAGARNGLASILSGSNRSGSRACPRTRDGLLCAGGSIARLGIELNSGGTSQYPSLGQAHVSIAGLVPATGGVRQYQAWYRDAAPFCTAGTFNLTNALELLWLP